MEPIMKVVYKAVVENNIEFIKNLLYNQHILFEDLNNEKHNESVLNVAISHNSYDIVKFLVEQGVDVNSKRGNACPLFLAIKLGHVKMTELLLELGASIEEGNLSNNTLAPLHFATHCMNLDIVKILLSRGADVNARGIYFRETALHIVANYFDLNRINETREDIIIQVKIAKALLEKGAAIDLRDCDFRAPVDCALGLNKIDLCKLLFTQGAPVKRTQVDGSHCEYLKCVVVYSCPELTRICLERGCNYNLIDEENGLTPYHCALHFGNAIALKVFLEFGCPYDLHDSRRGIANFMLRLGPNEENLKLLSIQKDFIKGVKSGSIEVVLKAISEGAEPKGCSLDVPSTLHFVAVNNNHELALLLLQKGVPVNRINERGETPLLLAIINKNPQVCKVFLQFGACINLNNCNKNPVYRVECDEVRSVLKNIYKLFRLVKQGNNRILKHLKEFISLNDNTMFFASMNCVNGKGLSLLALALQMGHTKIAEALMKLRIERM